MEKIDIKNFIEQIKLESTYRKFLEKDIIYQLIDIFNIEITKIDYLVTIKNPLKLALQFYKEYNIEKISAKRVINSNANNRGNVDEVLIRNYDENK